MGKDAKAERTMGSELQPRITVPAMRTATAQNTKPRLMSGKSNPNKWLHKSGVPSASFLAPDGLLLQSAEPLRWPQ